MKREIEEFEIKEEAQEITKFTDSLKREELPLVRGELMTEHAVRKFRPTIVTYLCVLTNIKPSNKLHQL